jgi:hypothetical protein
MTLGRSLVLPRRPGKSYVHAADLFDALTRGLGGWRRARLRCHARLESGALALPIEEARGGACPMAQLRFTDMGAREAQELLLIPVSQQPSPISSQPIDEEALLAGGQLHAAGFAFQERDRSQPFGLKIVTAALEVLWDLFPEEEWLLVEMDLPNPAGWRPGEGFRINLTRRLGRRFVFFVVEHAGDSVGSLQFCRHQPSPIAPGTSVAR